MKFSTHLIIILLLASSISCENINLIFRDKILATKPSQGPTDLIPKITGGAFFFNNSCSVSDIGRVIYKNLEYTIKYPSGKTVKMKLTPNKYMEVLKFSPSFENFFQEKSITAGQFSSSFFEGYIGRKTGNSVEVRAVISSGSGDIGIPYDSIKYKSCKNSLLVKNCEWKTKHVPRGLNNQEVMIINNALQNVAHQKAIEAIPVSLQGEAQVEEREVKIGRKVAREVDVEHVADVVAILTGKRKEEVEKIVVERMSEGKIVIEDKVNDAKFLVGFEPVGERVIDVYVEDLE